jgi:hypothetical protein
LKPISSHFKGEKPIQAAFKEVLRFTDAPYVSATQVGSALLRFPCGGPRTLPVRLLPIALCLYMDAALMRPNVTTLSGQRHCFM